MFFQVRWLPKEFYKKSFALKSVGFQKDKTKFFPSIYFIWANSEYTFKGVII